MATERLRVECESSTGPEATHGRTSGGGTYPAQLILYGSGTTTTVEGTAQLRPDGTIVISVALSTRPAPGTPIQVIVYGPGEPKVYEGRVGTIHADGSFEIILNH